VEALVHTNSSTDSKWGNPKSKKNGFRKSTTTTTIAATIEAKQRDFSNYKYCNDLSVVLNKELRPENSNWPRQVQAS
jgi:hypothetical protein